YGLDLLINTVSNLIAKFECPVENGKVMEYVLPKKFENMTFTKAYHEKIEFTYLTEQQYGNLFVQSDSFKGLQLSMDFSVDGDFYLNLEIGYDHMVSLFDIYLSYESKVIAVGESLFNKG